MSRLNIKGLLSRLLNSVDDLDTRVDDLDTRVDAVETLESLPHVVKAGSASTTSGRPFTWTYRKWSDGTAECWGYSSAANYTLSNASGYGYYISESAYLPSGLFTSVDMAVGSRKQGSGSSPSNALIIISTSNISKNNVNYWVICTASLTQSLSIVMYVKGKWK